LTNRRSVDAQKSQKRFVRTETEKKLHRH
jgi:hypothetical protein